MSFIQHEIEPLAAGFVPSNEWLVMQPEFFGDCSSTFVVAKQNDLHVGVQLQPAAKRVALYDGTVPAERLGGGDKGEHGWASFPLRGRNCCVASALARNHFSNNGVEVSRDCPIRIVPPEFCGVGDIADVVAFAGPVDAAPVELAFS